MSAQRLRAAASVLRVRAEAATPGPWRWEQYRDDLPFLVGRMGSPGTYEYDQEVIEAEHRGECGCRSACHLELSVRPTDRTYIATMHPGVGIALADWLEAAAENAEFMQAVIDAGRGENPHATLSRTPADRLADLILGGAS